MTRGSGISNRCPSLAGARPPGEAASAPATDLADPLTRQLRQMYGTIAEEPIPEAIVALLERLKSD